MTLLFRTGRRSERLIERSTPRRRRAADRSLAWPSKASKSRSSVRSSSPARPGRSTARPPVELVVYLAFHRGGVRHAEWALAHLARPAVSPAPPLHSTVLGCPPCPGSGRRRPAAPSPRGRPANCDGSVTTDVERFASLAASDDPRQLLGHAAGAGPALRGVAPHRLGRLRRHPVGHRVVGRAHGAAGSRRVRANWAVATRPSGWSVRRCRSARTTSASTARC